MVYWYNSTSFLDDLAWAASWMYRATLDTAYLSDAVKFFEMHRGDVRAWPAPLSHSVGSGLLVHGPGAGGVPRHMHALPWLPSGPALVHVQLFAWRPCTGQLGQACIA